MIATSAAAKNPFAIPRNLLHNRFVYVTVSPRAKGLSVGVNMNPDKQCNFDCVYCEVNRGERRTEQHPSSGRDEPPHSALHPTKPASMIARSRRGGRSW